MIFVVCPQITWAYLKNKQASETIIKTDGLGENIEDKKKKKKKEDSWELLTF